VRGRGVKCRWALLAALLAALLLPARRAAAVELKIEAPSFTFDSDRRIYRYQEARIVLGDMSLEAQEVLINEQTATLQATGQLRMRSGTMFISADRLDLDVETQSGIATNARAYDSATGYYLRAATLNILPGRAFAARCTLTSCPPLVPGWKLTVRNLDYRSDDFAVGQNTTLELGDVPVFWIPIVAWPTVTKRRSGVLMPELWTRVASLSRFDLGTRLAVPVYIDFGPDQDLTLTPEVIERRGPALNAEYRYAYHGDQVGRLRIWGVDEAKARDPGQENDILAPGEAQARDPHPLRYMLDFGHNEGIGDSGRLVMSATRSSDGQVRREYDFLENYRPESIYQATVSNQASWGDVAVSAEHASEFKAESLYADRDIFTDGGIRPQLAPRASYGKGWRPVDSWPLGVELTGALTRFDATADVSGNAAVARPSLSLPIRLGEGFELRTQLGRQFVSYDSLAGSDRLTGEQVPGSLGFGQNDAEMELRGTFVGNFAQDAAGIPQFRHRMVPRLIYNEVEDVRQPLADRLLRARIAEQLVTFRLDNSFIGRQGQPLAPQPYEPTNLVAGRFDNFRLRDNQYAPVNAPADSRPAPSLEVAHFDLIQRYNLLLESDAPIVVGPALPSVQETKPGQPLLPLIAQAGFARGGLNVNVETHYHHQLERITETILGMSASVRAYSSLSIGYSQNEFTYRTPENKLHTLGSGVNFGGDFEVADATSMGFSASVGLRDTPYPLGRRLENAEVHMDFHPLCYSIRVSLADALQVTQANGQDVYYTSRTLRITLNLGTILSTSREQIFTAGAPQ
jgi:hypothetical protein